VKLSLTPSRSAPLETLIGFAPQAEQLGYHGLWRAEGVAWDAFTVCALWAERSTRLQLATGIVSAVTRQPGALARAAITLQEQSRGRFRLGLGIGNNPEVPQPASPLREMLRVTSAVRGHWRDRLVPDVTQPAPAIWFAALRPKMVALAAEAADGVILNWVTAEHVRVIRRQVGPKFPIACFVRACAGSRDAAVAALRDNLPFYRALPVYRKSLELQGLDPDNLSDDDALRLVVRAPADLTAWQEAGVDEIVLRPVGADDTATIKALAPGG
jgi:alkanesulfonate monooxygenase SsuD/methylene tetrahydromethanopterin reductase-like flavin-dependent oxidoreductase (luciferase family)